MTNSQLLFLPAFEPFLRELMYKELFPACAGMTLVNNPR